VKILCVLNPLAADGMALRKWPQVASLLAGLGAEYELLADPSTPVDTQVARRLAPSTANEFHAIAGVGGDGTHSAIINALMAYSSRNPQVRLPPYAFIPLGTGNDIAQSLGLNAREDFFVSDLRRAVSTVLHGAEYRLDLGILGGRYFADALTVGLDSRILHERNVRRQRLAGMPLLRDLIRGRLVYTLCTGLTLWRQSPVPVEITVDEKTWYSGPMLNVVVNNTQVYAGEFCFFRNTYGNDGLLDVILFTGPTDYLRKYLLAIRHNPARIRQVSERLLRVSSHVQGRHICIQLSREVDAQMDGEEIAACAAFDVRVVPGAILIKTPAEGM
jgi:diacylglycerol kinase family enzyme